MKHKMKYFMKTITFCLIVFMIIPILFSCTDKGFISDETLATKQETKDNGATNYAIIYSSASEGQYKKICEKLQADLKTIANIESTIYTDKETIKADEKVILVGLTNHILENIVVVSRGFQIGIEKDEIAIIGYNSYDTICGVFYFIENIVQGSKGYLNITKDYLYKSAAVNTLTCGEYLTYVDVKDELKITKCSQSFTTATANTMVQGGCTDGEYFYVITNDGKDDSTAVSYVLKVDPTTYKVVATSKAMNVGHANDATYDSKNNRILIVWNSVDSKCVSYFNRDTLIKNRNTITAGVGFFAIAYNATRNQYVGIKTGTYDYVFFDENFNAIGTKIGKDTGNTKQGIDCDDQYIYFIQTHEGMTKNSIVVYDWEGKYVRTFAINEKCECENIFWYKGSLYSTANSSSGILLLKLDFKIDY